MRFVSPCPWRRDGPGPGAAWISLEKNPLSVQGLYGLLSSQHLTGRSEGESIHRRKGFRISDGTSESCRKRERKKENDLNESLLAAIQAEPQAAAEMELLVDLVQVTLDGSLADSQPL